MLIPTFHKCGEIRFIFVVFCVVEFTINIATSIATSTSPRNHHKVCQILYWKPPQLHHNCTTTAPQLYIGNHHNFTSISPQLDHHNLWCFMWCFHLGEIHHIYFSQCRESLAVQVMQKLNHQASKAPKGGQAY